MLSDMPKPGIPQIIGADDAKEVDFDANSDRTSDQIPTGPEDDEDPDYDEVIDPN